MGNVRDINSAKRHWHHMYNWCCTRGGCLGRGAGLGTLAAAGQDQIY